MNYFVLEESIRFEASWKTAYNLTLILTEYRYKFSKTIYVNTITDYGLYQDLTSTNNPKKIKKLIGLGIGTVIQTPNGLLRINLTNGGANTQEIQLYNTIINICYNVKF